MDHVRKAKGQSKMTYSELEEEYKLLKMSKETDIKQFEDIYTEIHDENKKLKAQILTLQMENAEFIGIKSKFDSILTCDECEQQLCTKKDLTDHRISKYEGIIFTCEAFGGQ